MTLSTDLNLSTGLELSIDKSSKGSSFAQMTVATDATVIFRKGVITNVHSSMITKEWSDSLAQQTTREKPGKSQVKMRKSEVKVSKVYKAWYSLRRKSSMMHKRSLTNTSRDQGDHLLRDQV